MKLLSLLTLFLGTQQALSEVKPGVGGVEQKVQFTCNWQLTDENENISKAEFKVSNKDLSSNLLRISSDSLTWTHGKYAMVRSEFEGAIIRRRKFVESKELKGSYSTEGHMLEMIFGQESVLHSELGVVLTISKNVKGAKVTSSQRLEHFYPFNSIQLRTEQTILDPDTNSNTKLATSVYCD